MRVVIPDSKELRGLRGSLGVIFHNDNDSNSRFAKHSRDLPASKKEYSEYDEKFLYFLATCVYLDPDIDLDIALKLRPYGVLMGIVNSSIDKYFKSYKILRLHAILHDASGFVFEYSEKGPGYSYVQPCPVTNEYLGFYESLPTPKRPVQ